MKPVATGGQINTEQLRQSALLQNVQAPVIIADHMKTPANAGGLYRLADAAGVNEILFVNNDDSKDFEQNKIVKRVSRHTSDKISSQYLSTQQLIEQKSSMPPWIAVELTTNAIELHRSQLPAQCCLVVGAEKRGISEALLECCELAVKIPMLGHNGSMNVTHALAIALYEWHRQHTFTTTQ